MKNLKKKLRILILRIRIFLATTKEILEDFWDPLPEDLKRVILALGMGLTLFSLADLLGFVS
jgi:hypothetical protein